MVTFTAWIAFILLEQKTICAFDYIGSKYTLYCGKDYMKRFCSSLRQHTRNITDFEKKKVLPLTKEELKSHDDARNCYICGKKNHKKSLYKYKLSKSYRSLPLFR